MLALSALTGCPYLFDPPDLSHVPCSGDGCDDTATLPGSAPTVVQFEVSPRSDGVVVHFALADLDADLVGGSIDLSDGSKHYVLSVPADIDEWEPSGTSTVTLYRGPWLDCTTPVSESWTLVPTDLAGHAGEAGATELVVAAIGLLPETPQPNLWPTDGATVPNPPPLMGCASWEVDAGDPRPDNQQLREDVEALYVTTPAPGDYVVQLWWTTACDVDLTIYPYPLVDEAPSDGYYDTIATSWNFGNVAEEATFRGIPSESWFVDFDFYEPLQGQSPPFQATFLVTPQ